MKADKNPQTTAYDEEKHWYIYVFVREDLSTPQIAVQACHACIEATKTFNVEGLPEHPSVVLLAAKNEQRLDRVRKYLIDQAVRHVFFVEPDMDSQMTAIATEPVQGDKRNIFSKYQLLRKGVTL